MKKILLLLICTLSLSACYQEEVIDIDQRVVEPPADTIDQYIQKNFIDQYGVAVRYKYVDRYVDPTKRVAPPSREVVQPMLDFLLSYWAGPFINVPNGEAFFKTHVPAEIIFVGSSIYNSDGTEILGTADAGARITLTRVNRIDESDQEWLFLQLGTIYHEFAHIVHQRYNLPPNFQQISPQGYTSAGSWYSLSDDEALRRGFVSPYATSSFNEDFAEVVAHLLYVPDFYEKYINQEPDCTDQACVERNVGRALIQEKVTAILKHYKQYTGVDLLEVRALVQQKYE